MGFGNYNEIKKQAEDLGYKKGCDGFRGMSEKVLLEEIEKRTAPPPAPEPDLPPDEQPTGSDPDGLCEEASEPADAEASSPAEPEREFTAEEIETAREMQAEKERLQAEEAERAEEKEAVCSMALTFRNTDRRHWEAELAGAMEQQREADQTYQDYLTSSKPAKEKLIPIRQAGENQVLTPEFTGATAAGNRAVARVQRARDMIHMRGGRIEGEKVTWPN